MARSHGAPPSSAAARPAASRPAARGSRAVERPVPMRTGIPLTILPDPAPSDRSRGGRPRQRVTGRDAAAAGLVAILAGMATPSVIAVFGPTGVGKTAVAVALAERLRGRGEDPVAIS